MRTPTEVAECRQAAADCRTAIELSVKLPGDADGMKHAKTMRGLAHELRGLIYQNLGEMDKALAEYERALSLDPYLVSTLLRRAVCAFDREGLRRGTDRLQCGHQHRYFAT